MARISKITLPDNSEYDLAVKYTNVEPIMSKTFTGVIGTANSRVNCWYYFGSVKPTTWTALWKIKYRLYIEAAGENLAKATSDCVVSGSRGSITPYAFYNEFASTDYRPVYYHEIYRLKEAGFNNGYGHSLGICLYASWKAYTAANARTVKVEIYECVNCEFEFYDSMYKYASIPGTGDTNYDTYTECNFSSNGLQETGDANDVNYYNRLYTGFKAYTTLYRYQILLTKDAETILPVNTVNNEIAATKSLTTESFDPFGEVYYYGTTTTVNANAYIANGQLYRQYLGDLRYSFNVVNDGVNNTLVARKPLYLVCAPQSDGSAKLYSTPLAQTLPNTEDGLYYKYLGMTWTDANPYRADLSLFKPVYMYKNGKIVEVTRSDYLPSVTYSDGLLTMER